MTSEPDRRHPGLQIEEDLGFQRREWAAQRVAWLLLLLALAAAALGFIGRGGAAGRAAAGDAGAIRVEYERFPHYQSPTTVRVTLGPGTARDGQVTLWVDRGWLESAVVQGIVPEPASQALGTDRVVMRFDAADPAGPMVVSLHVRPNDAGPMRGRIGLQGGSSAALAQFVWP